MARERPNRDELKAGKRRASVYRTHRAASDTCPLGFAFLGQPNSYHTNHMTIDGKSLRCPTECKSKIVGRVTHHWSMTSCKRCLGKRPIIE